MRFYTAAGVAIGYEALGILPHGRPEGVAGQCLVSYIAAGVPGNRGLVAHPQDAESEIWVVRDRKAVLIEQVTLRLSVVCQGEGAVRPRACAQGL